MQMDRTPVPAEEGLVMNDLEKEAAELRTTLRVKEQPSTPRGHGDAGVLIVLDRIDGEYNVLLCVRNKKLRKHPGEVCFPGGMRDNGENLRETALREAHEEVGLLPDDVIMLGSLPPFTARFGITIHPTVVLLRRKFRAHLNASEVERIFWKPLEDFLQLLVHDGIVISGNYAIHLFLFSEAATYGITALMAIVVAMGVLQRFPEFDLSPMITVEDMKSHAVDDVIDQVFTLVLTEPKAKM